jgi:hypothetical protein
VLEVSSARLRLFVRGAAVGCSALLSLTCCASRQVRSSSWPSAQPQVLGVPADMRTLPGTYDGYEVFRSCEDGAGEYLSLIAVIGTGSVEFPFLAKGFDSNGNLDRDLKEQFRREAEAAAGAFIHGTGFGVPCRGAKLAFHMDLADWRQVDAVIDGLGKWLRQKRYRGEIIVNVRSRPMLL